MRRLCRECGKPFETTSSRRLYCYADHYRTCKGCGKPFLVSREQLSRNVVTCSEACRRRAISSSEVYRTPRFTCTCVKCGKTFLSPTSKSLLCPDDHYNICEVCGKAFKITEYSQINKSTCSNDCRYKLAHAKFMSHVDESVAHGRDTMVARYGVLSPLQVSEFVEKSKQTCLEKYGVTSFTKTPEFVEKTIKTCQSRYGTDWYMQTDEYKSSVVKTSMAKYGVTNPGKYADFIVDKMKHPEQLPELMAFRDDPTQYVAGHFDAPPTLQQLAACIGVSETTVGDIISARGLGDIVVYQYSRMEDEVYAFLREHLPDTEIVRNTFAIITPYELDIYLPEYNIAFECNPTSTHNSTLGIFKGPPKPPNYHKMKTDLCESRGVRLIHIFGYDWDNHRETCKSIMLNAVHKTPKKYYARKLDVRQVSGSDAHAFLAENHRQGAVHCKVRLGLYSNNELLALMTFSKLRHTIGTGSDDTSECWELVRFCNKNYINTVGGASKLLTHFIRMYEPKEIRSFSDRAHTTGGIYQTLGFTELRRSDPGYVWVCQKTNKAYSRYNAQKHNIVNFLKDPDIDLSKTEVEIMAAHGYVQVYDSGTITWQLFPSKGGSNE